MKPFATINYNATALVRQYSNLNFCVINEDASSKDPSRTTARIVWTCRDNSNAYYGNKGSIRCDGLGTY